jgi:hypothetical protein
LVIVVFAAAVVVCAAVVGCGDGRAVADCIEQDSDNDSETSDEYWAARMSRSPAGHGWP